MCEAKNKEIAKRHRSPRLATAMWPSFSSPPKEKIKIHLNILTYKQRKRE
jgi:hypothetical protein